MKVSLIVSDIDGTLLPAGCRQDGTEPDGPGVSDGIRHLGTMIQKAGASVYIGKRPSVGHDGASGRAPRDYTSHGGLQRGCGRREERASLE